MKENDTTMLRKSFKNVINDGVIKFPDPKVLPRTGTGKPQMEQGRGGIIYRDYINGALEKNIEELKEIIEKELPVRFK